MDSIFLLDEDNNEVTDYQLAMELSNKLNDESIVENINEEWQATPNKENETESEVKLSAAEGIINLLKKKM